MTPTVLHALKGQRNVEELLRAIPNALRPLLAFDRVSLALDRSVSSTPCWQELDGECAVLSADDEIPADLAAHGLLSSCVVPLSTPHLALGPLGIASRRAKAYSDDDVHLLTIVADAIAVALDNALSQKQLRDEHDRLTLLFELTNLLVSNLETRGVLILAMMSDRPMTLYDTVDVNATGAKSSRL